MLGQTYPSPPDIPRFPSKKVVEQLCIYCQEKGFIYAYLLKQKYAEIICEEAEVNTIRKFHDEALNGKVRRLHNKEDISDLSDIEMSFLRNFLRRRGRWEAEDIFRVLGRDRRSFRRLPPFSVKSIDEAPASMSFDEIQAQLTAAYENVKGLSRLHQRICLLAYRGIKQKAIMKRCKIGYVRYIRLWEEIQEAVLAY